MSSGLPSLASSPSAHSLPNSLSRATSASADIMHLVPEVVCLMDSSGLLLRTNIAFDNCMCSAYPISLPKDIIHRDD